MSPRPPMSTAPFDRFPKPPPVPMIVPARKGLRSVELPDFVQLPGKNLDLGLLVEEIFDV